MGFLSDLAKQKGRNRNEAEYRHNTCYNCKRIGGRGEIKLLTCIFAVDPTTYDDFLYNESICNYCFNEICHIFQNDFFIPNEDLVDGYSYLKNGGFFENTRNKKENEIVFILGIRPNMPDDYHVLLVDKEYARAVDNVYKCLIKGADRNKIKNFNDLLR